MKKQFVIFGADRFGASIARTLESNGCQVIVVDNDQDRVDQIADDVSYAMKADITDPDAVASLGLKNVDGAVVSMVDHMEASVIAVMVCVDMGLKTIIARARSDMHGHILEKIGATQVVYPEQEMGARIGRFLAQQDFMDFIALSPDYSLVEVKMQSEWVGKSLIQIDMRRRYGMNVVGLRRGNEIVMRIRPEEPLQADDVLIVIGSNESLSRFQE